ncbi:MAG: hypothetical protein QNJ63_14925 [Calothrix sp. MO_192.B10]|nr:hypothetical protein [Calothrix sp. MO_192.B10]
MSQLKHDNFTRIIVFPENFRTLTVFDFSFYLNSGVAEWKYEFTLFDIIEE